MLNAWGGNCGGSTAEEVSAGGFEQQMPVFARRYEVMHGHRSAVVHLSCVIEQESCQHVA